MARRYKNQRHRFLTRFVLLGAVCLATPVRSETAATPEPPGVTPVVVPSATPTETLPQKAPVTPRMKKGDEGFGDKMMKFIQSFFQGPPPQIDENLVRDDF